MALGGLLPRNKQHELCKFYRQNVHSKCFLFFGKRGMGEDCVNYCSHAHSVSPPGLFGLCGSERLGRTVHRCPTCFLCYRISLSWDITSQWPSFSHLGHNK